MNRTTKVFVLIVLIVLIILSRSHDSTLVHLPDFTLLALIIAGVYLPYFGVAFSLIFSAVLMDNYAIFYQGVAANCITPAYSLLLLLYYLSYYFARYIPSLDLAQGKTLGKSMLILLSIIVGEWLLATTSYYAFSTALWGDFAHYVLKWSMIEIPTTLAQLVLVCTLVSLIHYLFLKEKAIVK